MNNQVIPHEAVEAAARVIREKGLYSNYYPTFDALRTILEAAAPHLMASVEWAIFRASDGPDGTPMENMRYKTRESAQAWIDAGFNRPEFWEVRGRVVGEWSK